MLRPLTTLGTAAITITGKGADRSLFYDKLKMDGVPKIVDDVLAVDLTGRTVSDLVLIYKTLTRTAKAAANTHKEYAGYGYRGYDTPHVPTTWEFSGDAAGYDLKALAKEPTPAEDWVTMRKVRKTASLTGAKWTRALELIGLEAELVKDGRKLVGFRMTLPGIDTEPSTYEIRYGVLAPAGEPDWREEREDPEGYKARVESHVAHSKAAKNWFVGKASALMGLDDPSERNGLPLRARDYRTDLTIRTCPVCFRDIKASDHTGKLMADHGFTINGRGYDGWGGVRRDSCSGTGELPWEKGCDPAKPMLASLEAYSATLATYLAKLESGEVTSLEVNDHYDYKAREYVTKTVTPADKYEWEKALAATTYKVEGALKELWSGYYGSIPWYRMAIRTWEPVADDHTAVGAPRGGPADEDYTDKPESLS